MTAVTDVTDVETPPPLKVVETIEQPKRNYKQDIATYALLLSGVFVHGAMFYLSTLVFLTVPCANWVIPVATLFIGAAARSPECLPSHRRPDPWMCAMGAWLGTTIALTTRLNVTC